MVETSLIIIVFLLLLGAVFDVGMALYQFSMLRHTTNKAARDVLVSLSSYTFPTNPTDACQRFNGIVETYIQNRAKPLMSTGGAASSFAEFRTCMRTGVDRFRALRVRGEMPAYCFFICRFFPNGWMLGADAAITVDSETIPTCQTNPSWTPAC